MPRVRTGTALAAAYAVAELQPTSFFSRASITPRVRWGWVLAVALGWLLGLIAAAAVGVTGARLGPPDAFDRDGYAPAEDVMPAPTIPARGEPAAARTRE